MEFIFIILSWMILLVPGFDDSVPPTDGKIFKIETSPDIVQSIKIQSDESFDFAGFDIVLKQNSTGTLEIKIPKNLPHPASYIGFWAYDERPIVLTDGFEIGYDVIEDPCYSHYRIPIEDKTNLEILYTVILTGSWQLYSPMEFDKDNPCYSNVFYQKPRESPLKQIQSGISFNKIQCKQNLVLIQKYDGSPACVTESTKLKLVERGWAKDDNMIPTFDYVIEKDGVTYGSQYQISGGTVDEIFYDKHSNSLVIPLRDSEKGFLQIVIQIGLLHSLEQIPFTYFVIVDGEEVVFEQLSPIMVKIPFEKGTKQIEIVGITEI